VRLVAAVEGRAATPATTAGDLTVDLDNEVGAILDRLRVDAHDRATRLDLRVVEETRCNSGIARPSTRSTRARRPARRGGY
jgi:hypothetical protein